MQTLEGPVPKTMYLHIYIYICILIYTCVCIYIYTCIAFLVGGGLLWLKCRGVGFQIPCLSRLCTVHQNMSHGQNSLHAHQVLKLKPNLAKDMKRPTLGASIISNVLGPLHSQYSYGSIYFEDCLHSSCSGICTYACIYI